MLLIIFFKKSIDFKNKKQQMNIINQNPLNLISSNKSILFKESLISEVTTENKKIFTIVTLALGFIAICFVSLITRQWRLVPNTTTMTNFVDTHKAKNEKIAKINAEIAKAKEDAIKANEKASLAEAEISKIMLEIAKKDEIIKAKDEALKAKEVAVANAEAEVSKVKVEIAKANDEAIKSKSDALNAFKSQTEATKATTEALNSLSELKGIIQKMGAVQPIKPKTELVEMQKMGAIQLVKRKRKIENSPKLVKQNAFKIIDAKNYQGNFKQQIENIVKNPTVYSIYDEGSNKSPSINKTLLAIRDDKVIGFISDAYYGYNFIVSHIDVNQKEKEVETELLLALMSKVKLEGNNHLKIRGELKWFMLKEKKKREEDFQKRIDLCESFKQHNVGVKHTLEFDKTNAFKILDVDFDLTHFDIVD